MSGAGQLLGNVVVDNKVVVELSVVVVAVVGDISDESEESYSSISSSSANSEITSCKGSVIKQYKLDRIQKIIHIKILFSFKSSIDIFIKPHLSADYGADSVGCPILTIKTNANVK